VTERYTPFIPFPIKSAPAGPRFLLSAGEGPLLTVPASGKRRAVRSGMPAAISELPLRAGPVMFCPEPYCTISRMKKVNPLISFPSHVTFLTVKN